MVELIILSLVCYRLARLIAQDEGPAIGGDKGIFLLLRIRAGAYDRGPDGQARTNWGRGISCVHCVGLWIAAPLAMIGNGFEWYTLVYWLAIAGGTSFLWSLSE